MWKVVTVSAMGLTALACWGNKAAFFSCPAVGSRPCPNDPPETQARFDECNAELAACPSQASALAACDPGAMDPTCNSSGMTVGSTTPSGCASQAEAFAVCTLTVASSWGKDGG
jgi:hypothetical protein